MLLEMDLSLSEIKINCTTKLALPPISQNCRPGDNMSTLFRTRQTKISGSKGSINSRADGNGELLLTGFPSHTATHTAQAQSSKRCRHSECFKKCVHVGMCKTQCHSQLACTNLHQNSPFSTPQYIHSVCGVLQIFCAAFTQLKMLL